ncbi:MAG: Bcr/CflA family efflux MFS transporter [Bacteroidales bacterium]|nr:Bcr/CflA family efflux MFS transporter [Bacteroidales bacterium]
MTSTPNNSKVFLAAYLGILSAFAPFVMDMYLASMPEIVNYFSTSSSSVQMSLAVCVVGLAIGQLLFGTISDSTGRKRPALWSLVAYLIVTFGCIYSPSIQWFIALRFVQGLASSGGVVIARSIVADCYTGNELTKMYGTVSMINGIATVLAPVFGGFIAVHHGWQGVFWTLQFLGLAMVPCTLWYRETLAKENRISIAPHSLLLSIKHLLGNSAYLIPCIGYSMLMSLIIVNLSSAPFIMTKMGMGEGGISLTLGANAIALAIMAMASAHFRNQKFLMTVSAIVILIGALWVAVVLWIADSYWLYESGVLVIYLGLGALNTASVSLAMDAGRAQAGMSSALLGALGYLAGGISTALEGLSDPFITTPWLLLSLAIITLSLSIIPAKK